MSTDESGSVGDPSIRQTAAQLATGERAKTLLQTEGLVKRFGGFTATDSVDFSVDEGEMRCLIGPNGAGKSTLLKLITGAIRASAGSIYYDGRDITTDEPHERVRRGISIKFQVPAVFGDLTVRENMRLPIQRLAHGEERRRRVDSALEAAGLSDHGSVEVSSLAHGQQQQLEIGIAAATEPKLLLLDEPVAGLDVEERRAIAERLQWLNEERGIAFVVIEHDTDFVAEIADHVTVLHRGRVFREGPIDEIEADPDVQRIYLGEGNE